MNDIEFNTPIPDAVIDALEEVQRYTWSEAFYDINVPDKSEMVDLLIARCEAKGYDLSREDAKEQIEYLYESREAEVIVAVEKSDSLPDCIFDGYFDVLFELEPEEKMTVLKKVLLRWLLVNLQAVVITESGYSQRGAWVSAKNHVMKAALGFNENQLDYIADSAVCEYFKYMQIIFSAKFEEPW